MPVKVRTTRRSDGRTVEVTHPEGYYLAANDGHLLVRNVAGNDAVAIYAPGHWTAAEVLQDEGK